MAGNNSEARCDEHQLQMISGSCTLSISVSTFLQSTSGYTLDGHEMTQLPKLFLVIVGQSSLESDEVELLLETMILCNQCAHFSIQYLTGIVIVIVGHRSGISKLLYVPDQLAFLRNALIYSLLIYTILRFYLRTATNAAAPEASTTITTDRIMYQ